MIVGARYDIDETLVRDLRSRGMSLAEIGEDLGEELGGIDKSVISRLLSGKQRQPDRTPGITREQMMKFVEQGLTIRKIAEEADVTYSTAKYWTLRYGVHDRVVTKSVTGERYQMDAAEAAWWRAQYEVLTIAELSTKTGLGETTVHYRLMQAGVTEFRHGPDH